VRDDRAFYDGKSILSPFIGLNGGVKIYHSFYLQGGINCEFSGSEITDSPLIEDKYVLSGVLIISYSF
jgi:outer membrane scaffolding protein for murein synthesis (MipA/OmpV family)